MSSVSERQCSQGRCKQSAEFSLTYDYDDQLAVIGPLSPQPEPLAHDLCRKHARGFTAPQGWELIRHLDLIND